MIISSINKTFLTQENLFFFEKDFKRKNRFFLFNNKKNRFYTIFPIKNLKNSFNRNNYLPKSQNIQSYCIYKSFLLVISENEKKEIILFCCSTKFQNVLFQRKVPKRFKVSQKFTKANFFFKIFY